MIPLRSLLLAATLAAVAGCSAPVTNRQMAGDIYAIRLAIETMQSNQTAATEGLRAEIRGARAHQDQEMNSLSRRIEMLEDEIARLEDAIERLRLSAEGFDETPGGEFTRAQRVLSLPPDPESRSGTTPPLGQGVPPPRAIESAPQSTTSLPASP